MRRALGCNRIVAPEQSHCGTRWTGFAGNCLMAFSLKPHTCSESRKCNILRGFPARDSFGVSPAVMSLWPRFEPFGMARGVKRVPWFGDEQRFATRKSPEFPRRNAKTRWGEPAGLERYGHLAATKSMEAAGIEPASRDTSDTASTCLADSYWSRPSRSLSTSVRCASLELF